MMRTFGVIALLLATLIAGCSDGGPKAQDADEPDAFDDVEVTDTTGAIRGIVYDEAITPIADVVVTLAGGANETTDADGAFVFSSLEPGDYFLSASKPGYNSIQQSATVVAGVGDPAITKIQLTVDLLSQPFVELYQWSGFLQCGAWAVAFTTNPCAFTGSDNVHEFSWGATGRIPDFAQAEAVWSGTQPAGNWLSMSFHDPNGPTGTESCFGVNSESPAVLNVTQEEIVGCEGDEAGSLTVKLFPGASQGTFQTPTVLANQKYDIYIQYFFGFTPRAGYTLAVDGVCDIPEKCM